MGAMVDIDMGVMAMGMVVVMVKLNIPLKHTLSNQLTRLKRKPMPNLSKRMLNLSRRMPKLNRLTPSLKHTLSPNKLMLSLSKRMYSRPQLMLKLKVFNRQLLMAGMQPNKLISLSRNINNPKLLIRSKDMFKNQFKDIQIQLLLGIIALLKLNMVNSNI